MPCVKRMPDVDAVVTRMGEICKREIQIRSNSSIREFHWETSKVLGSLCCARGRVFGTIMGMFPIILLNPKTQYIC